MRIESQSGVLHAAGLPRAGLPCADFTACTGPLREKARCIPPKGLEGLPGPITALSWATAAQVGDALRALQSLRDQPGVAAVDYAEWLRRANREEPGRHIVAPGGRDLIHPPRTAPACPNSAAAAGRAGPPPANLSPSVPAPRAESVEPWDALKMARRVTAGRMLIIRPVPAPVGRLIDLIA